MQNNIHLIIIYSKDWLQGSLTYSSEKILWKFIALSKKIVKLQKSKDDVVQTAAVTEALPDCKLHEDTT
jgi:hypothetical protein